MRWLFANQHEGISRWPQPVGRCGHALAEHHLGSQVPFVLSGGRDTCLPCELSPGLSQGKSRLEVCIPSQPWRLHLNHGLANHVTAHMEKEESARFLYPLRGSQVGLSLHHYPAPHTSPGPLCRKIHQWFRKSMDSEGHWSPRRMQFCSIILD